MSSWDRPDEDPTRRIAGDGEDRTGRLGPDETARQEAVGDPDRTEAAPRILSYEQESWPQDPAPADPGALEGAPVLGPDEDAPEPRSRGREVLIGLACLLLGFVLAFVVVAIGTGDGGGDDGEVAAAQEEVAALQQQVAERDALLEEREARIAELEAQVAELETQVADAQAAAGEGEAALEAQREALDERAAALDERAQALEEREAALDQAPPAEPGEAPPGDEAPGDGFLPEVPQIDGETAETVVEQVLARLRELLPGGG